MIRWKQFVPINPLDRGGRVFIVNQSTLKTSLKYGFAAIGGDLSKFQKRIKTTCDLLADICALRKGDYVFFWIVSDIKTLEENLGFMGTFQVDGEPFFDTTPIETVPATFPIRVPIKVAGFYQKTIPEYEALTSPDGETLWNPRYKKALGRGRSCTPLTPWETAKLSQMIKRKNNNKKSRLKFRKYPGDDSQKILIKLEESNPRTHYTDETFPEDFSKVEFGKIPFVRDGNFTAEKALEAWMTQNIDTNQDLLKIVGESKKILWFGNYLPYSIMGGNIDIMLYVDENGELKITVIELTKGTINCDYVDKVMRYAEWLATFLSGGDYHAVEDVDMSAVEPILIGHDVSPSAIRYADSRVRIYKYIIKNGSISFSKIT